MDLESGADAKNLYFFEYGHVVLQIQGNEAYNNMLANILPLHIPSIPVVGEVKGHFFSFLKAVMLYPINGIEAENIMQANIQKVKPFF